MKRREEIREELEKLSPLLAKLKETDPGFKTPEGYFQQLPEDIMERIRREERTADQPVVRNSWWERLLSELPVLRQPRYAMALAAVVLLITAGVWWLRPAPSAAGENLAWEEISTEAISDYISENIQDFDVELLVNASKGLDQRSILSGSDLDKETLDNYLDDLIKDIELEDLEVLF